MRRVQRGARPRRGVGHEARAHHARKLPEVRHAQFKAGGVTSVRSAAKSGEPYDSTRTYRAGQSMTHPVFGVGEVTAVVEPRKIDVLFPDRMRRLIHART